MDEHRTLSPKEVRWRCFDLRAGQDRRILKNFFDESARSHDQSRNGSSATWPVKPNMPWNCSSCTGEAVYQPRRDRSDPRLRWNHPPGVVGILRNSPSIASLRFGYRASPVGKSHLTFQSADFTDKRTEIWWPNARKSGRIRRAWLLWDCEQDNAEANSNLFL